MSAPSDHELDAAAAALRRRLDRLVTQIIPEDDPAHVTYDDFDRKREWYRVRRERQVMGSPVTPGGWGRSPGVPADHILARFRRVL